MKDVSVKNLFGNHSPVFIIFLNFQILQVTTSIQSSFIEFL